MAERPEIEDIIANLRYGAWEDQDLREYLTAQADRIESLERAAAEQAQEYAEYREHSDDSHRYMVDENAALERELGVVRQQRDLFAKHLIRYHPKDECEILRDAAALAEPEAVE